MVRDQITKLVSGPRVSKGWEPLVYSIQYLRILIEWSCLNTCFSYLMLPETFRDIMRSSYDIDGLVGHNPSVCPDVYLRDNYIHDRRSWTMSPEVRTPRRGCCIANFHKAIWASQLPLSWPDSLEQFAVRTEGQGNYIVDVWTETEDIFIFAGVLIVPMRPG